MNDPYKATYTDKHDQTDSESVLMKRQKNDQECVEEHTKRESYHRQRQDAPDTYDVLLQLLIMLSKHTY